MQKRYEYFGKGGAKTFTPWFEFRGEDRPKWQLKNLLRNEYRETESLNTTSQ